MAQNLFATTACLLVAIAFFADNIVSARLPPKRANNNIHNNDIAQNTSKNSNRSIKTANNPNNMDNINNINNEPFIWGTGTAAYQIEGAITADGREASIWDTFCNQTGAIYNGESGKFADNSYYLYETDAKIMSEVGVSHSRMSLSWSRILPDGETLNMAGINHYISVLQTLQSYNIKPVVTLYHWDLPQKIYDITNGGWINSTIADYFVKYATTVFDYLSDYATIWTTFNEPWTFCIDGYLMGVHAPGRCSNHTKCPNGGNSSTEPYLCAHNVLRSHARVSALFHNNSNYNQNGISKLGLNLNINGAFPASNSIADYNASLRNFIWQGAWFADPVYFGDYPTVMKNYIGSRLPTFTDYEKQLLKGSVDYFGLNHYTSGWVINCTFGNNVEKTWLTDQRACPNATNQYNDTVIGVTAASSWLQVVPQGIYHTLKWVYDRYMDSDGGLYSNQSIYITENGVDDPYENETHIVLQDDFRVNFLKNYTSYVMQAYNEGITVRGYFVWSILDNFEWADGYSKRFGIYAVNYTTGNYTRTQRDSAKWYSEFIQSNP